MAKRDAGPAARAAALFAEIDELRAKLNAALDEFVAQDHVDGIPDGVTRNLITRQSACLCEALRSRLQKEGG
jgi:hypothetical protein